MTKEGLLQRIKNLRGIYIHGRWINRKQTKAEVSKTITGLKKKRNNPPYVVRSNKLRLMTYHDVYDDVLKALDSEEGK